MLLEKTKFLDDRYKLLRQIGKGSEGKVYLAFQEHTFRFYAIKRIEKNNACFSKEGIEVWKRLQNRGLPEIVDILDQENELWIVMEYIEGISLKVWMEKNGLPSEKQIIRWGIEICKTLEYLHSQKPPIVYGDLKPDNIIIQKNMPILVDLGSAVLRGSKGKRTGTKEFEVLENYEEPNVKEDVKNLGMLLLILSGGKRNRDFCRFEKKIQEEWLKQSALTIFECRKQLEKRKKGPVRNLILLIAAMLLLSSGLILLIKEREKENKNDQYAYFVKSAEVCLGDEKRDQILEALKYQPEREEAYLLLLDSILEDKIFTVEEDVFFRKILNEPDEKSGDCFEELLKNNLSGYEKVCYETGIAYWYYYAGREGKAYASSWFEKVCSIPKAVSIDKDHWEKSRLYEKMEKERLKMEKYEVTGEEGDVFRVYWKDMRELAASGESHDATIRYMFWMESLSIVRQYLMEFYQAGVSEEELKVYLEQMENELDRLPGERQVLKEQREEIQRIRKLLEEEMKRILDKGGKNEIN